MTAAIGGPSDVYVYRLFDEDGSLLYIGCTNKVERRIAEHRRYRRSLSAATYTVEGPFTYERGRRAEALAIWHEQPRLNIWGKGRLMPTYSAPT